MLRARSTHRFRGAIGHAALARSAPLGRRIRYTCRALGQLEPRHGHAAHAASDVARHRPRRRGCARCGSGHRHGGGHPSPDVGGDPRPRAPVGARLDGLRHSSGRPGGHLHVERLAPFGGVPRRRRHGRGAAHVEHPPRRGRSRIHHWPRGRPAHHCGRRCPPALGTVGGARSHRRTHRRGGGGRLLGLAHRRCAGGGLRRVHRRPPDPLRVAGTGRVGAARPLLHQWHNRPAQGRGVRAPLPVSAHDGAVHDGRDGTVRRGHGAWRRADVSTPWAGAFRGRR